jgi:uncharacterized protein with HEPN domain
VSDHRLYLEYILECISNIEELAVDGREALEAHKHHRAAVLHYLQTMAETTQRIPDDLKSQQPEVDWVGISGFRNRLVHGYLEINMDIIWNVIEKYLPELKWAVKAMLEIMDSDNA